MQSIIEGQLAANRELLADLVRVDRIDQQAADMHIRDGECLAAGNIVFEVRASQRREQPTESFRIEFSGVVYSESANG
ncbi:hypothetical protein XI04_03095 [Bradyrhizobium sp. CCBAU 11430]|nr:hypothetical protein [Bradyrhizobium sp. CCBAU 11430]